MTSYEMTNKTTTETSRWTDKQTNERTNERTNEQTNKQTNKHISSLTRRQVHIDWQMNWCTVYTVNIDINQKMQINV